MQEVHNTVQPAGKPQVTCKQPSSSQRQITTRSFLVHEGRKHAESSTLVDCNTLETLAVTRATHESKQ